MKYDLSCNLTLTDNKAGSVVILCWLVYLAAYLGRLNFNASMIDILYSLGATKAQMGLVSSSFYIAYGSGQLINGILANKFNPKHMITFSLLLSALINLVFPLATTAILMRYLWFMNGLIQSLLWVNIIRIYSIMLPTSVMPRSIMIIHTSGAAGTLAVYGITAICLKYVSWHATFYFAAFMLVAVGLFWLFGMNELEKNRIQPRNDRMFHDSDAPENEKKRMSLLPVFMMSGFLFALYAAVADGGIRDGITMWVPTLIHEKYNVSTSFSVFVTLLLPVFSLSGAAMAIQINKKLTNIFYTTAVFFVIALVALVFLNHVNNSLLITCLLFAMISSSMTAINTMIVSYLPLKLRNFGITAVAAGLTNSFCYIGSTLASYGLGTIADRFGWNKVVIVLRITVFSALIASLAGGVLWAGFCKKNLSLERL